MQAGEFGVSSGVFIFKTKVTCVVEFSLNTHRMSQVLLVSPGIDLEAVDLSKNTVRVMVQLVYCL